MGSRAARAAVADDRRHAAGARKKGDLWVVIGPVRSGSPPWALSHRVHRATRAWFPSGDDARSASCDGRAAGGPPVGDTE